MKKHPKTSNSHPNTTVLLALFVLLTATAMDQVAEKTAYVKDGRIVIETAEGIKSVDFTMERGYRTYMLRDKFVREEVDVTHEALKVYAKKQAPVYHKRLWISGTLNDGNETYIEFVTNEYNEDIVFSPAGDFVYYQVYTPDGEHKIYGVKVGTDEDFFVGTADDFYTKTCESNSLSYLITTENGQIDSYHIFNLNGEQVQFKGEIKNIDDLSSVICF